MNSKNYLKIENIIDYIRSSDKRKIGLICLNCIFNWCKIDELENFIDKYQIKLPEKSTLTRLEYIKFICLNFVKKFNDYSEIRNSYKDPLSLLGRLVISDNIFQKYIKKLDYIAKQDLINVFSDFCADLGIIVYKTSNTSIKSSIDLYLTKKKPFLRTESVFLRTGYNLNEEVYDNTLSLIKGASEVSIWTVFVTTPIGVLKIGIEKLISDMKKLNCWLYVVDPGRKEIFGIVKGRKNEKYDVKLRDRLIKELPREPIRVPSRVLKISKFKFSESKSYNPQDFGLFEIMTDLEHNKLILKEDEPPKYAKSFRDFIIIDRLSGIPIISYASEDFKDQTLTSGFLSAMDSFVAEMSGSASMKDISYKGFYVQASYGDFVKIACFLSEPADESLRERLDYFISYFEKTYKKEILKFVERGASAQFNKQEILDLIKEILDI